MRERTARVVTRSRKRRAAARRRGHDLLHALSASPHATVVVVSHSIFLRELFSNFLTAAASDETRAAAKGALADAEVAEPNHRDAYDHLRVVQINYLDSSSDSVHSRMAYAVRALACSVLPPKDLLGEGTDIVALAATAVCIVRQQLSVRE